MPALEAILQLLDAYIGQNSDPSIQAQIKEQVAIRYGIGITTTVDVAYWDSPKGSEKPFAMQITDQRNNGQVFIDIGAKSGNIDDILAVTAEINELRGVGAYLPCLHVHFDESNLAASCYKYGDKILVRPETGVTIEDVILPNGERGYEIVSSR